ncbi:fumarylacetoacetate hydrolase family protein [Nocardioides sp. NPDC127514]|uniref:fumarylacetoacetate hydrolase family protein n=1 Tax=unclassified Nocardioides TaxID=2615069 RepID=UPI00331FACF9
MTATPDAAQPKLPVLASVRVAGQSATAAVVHDSCVSSLRSLLPGAPATLTEVVRAWDVLGDRVEALLAEPETATQLARSGMPLSEVEILAPVTDTQTFCAIGNYRGQLAQVALDVANDADDPRQILSDLERGWRERRSTGAPYVALTGSARIAGAFDNLELDDDVTTLDWEVELAAVIGRRAMHLRPESALEVVAGYCVANDLTMRGSVLRSDVPGLGGDWLACKGRPGWLPLGPWLVPAGHVPDPDSLGLELRLNGVTMQAERTSDMLFSIAEVIAHVSQHTELRPGDVVCTGSPAGFGAHYGRFLRAGDVLDASVAGLGTQRTTVVRSSAPVRAGVRQSETT